jgi:hypothetical protein
MSRATVVEVIGTFKISGTLFAIDVVRIKLRPKQPTLWILGVGKEYDFPVEEEKADSRARRA